MKNRITQYKLQLGRDQQKNRTERNQMELETETESHDLHRIHGAYGHLPYGFFSCRGVHSGPWLTTASWLSLPGISLARVELVLQGTLGDACWWRSSILAAPGCFTVVSFTSWVG